MGVLGGIVRGGLIIGTVVLIGSAWSAQKTAKHTVTENEQTIMQLNSQIAKEKKKSPSVKTVNTSYQNAMDAAKQFAAFENTVHDAGNIKTDKAQDAVNSMNAMVDTSNGGSAPSMPLVPFDIKNWHIEVSYGGQHSDGSIALGYRVFNDKKVLMSLTTFDYNDTTGKLSKFVTYPTFAGKHELQVSLLDPAHKGGTK